MTAAQLEAQDAAWKPAFNPWVIALTVTLATFMEVLDTSIANVSLPHIAGSLSATQEEATWVLTSYLVSNAIVLPISGWMASKIGRKRFYMTCVGAFIVSSFLCGIAPSLGWLVFFRVLQGIGGGGLGPSEQSILIDTFPPAKRGMAFAVYGMAVVLAPAIGPTLGGYITDHMSWRWVFFINVPVGIVSLILSSRIVQDPPYLKRLREKSGGVDYIGLSLIALGLGALEVVLDKGNEDDWFGSRFIVTFSIVAVVALAAFIIWELGQENPVVDIRLLGKRNFAVANVMMLVLGITLLGSTVLLPLFLQTLMGYTAELAGMVLSPGGIVVILLLPLVGALTGRVDLRFLIAFGFGVLSISLFYMTRHLYLGIDFRTAMELRMFQSVGMAFLFVPINTMATMGLPREKGNAASGIINLFRNMGGDFGISLVSFLLLRRTAHHQSILARTMVSGSPDWEGRLAGAAQGLVRMGSSAFAAQRQAIGLMYGALVRQATTLAYLDILWIMAVFTLVMVPAVFLMKRVKTSGGPAMAH
ncbi:MAG TPA: DHA2 family efflux MFS transporter permease subunit [Myxococcales bacterium]|nr:DHA2 family efflux MFS transporter permease subunit [Myxococcales bacterium]